MGKSDDPATNGTRCNLVGLRIDLWDTRHLAAKGRGSKSTQWPLKASSYYMTRQFSAEYLLFTRLSPRYCGDWLIRRKKPLPTVILRSRIAKTTSSYSSRNGFDYVSSLGIQIRERLLRNRRAAWRNEGQHMRKMDKSRSRIPWVKLSFYTCTKEWSK